MIDKIFNKLGYYKLKEVRDLTKKPFTEYELSSMYLDTLGDLTDFVHNEKEETKMFNDVKGISGFAEYLRAMSAYDVRRYFSAENDKQRDLIKGLFARAIYLRSRLTGKKQDAVETKITGLRYGE